MSNNIYGIDFGTCNFKVFSKSSGKVISEKNTIAIINKTQIYAYGDDAYAMYEKAPESINVTFPVSTGVIADYNFLQTMIFDYIEKKLKGRVKNAEFLVAVPTDITDVEKRAFFELFYKSKFRPKNVMLCEKPLADAVGLGIDVNQPTGVMVVDMGADTIEISVISLGGLVLSDLMHFGSNRLDESIISYIRREFNLVIGIRLHWRQPVSCSCRISQPCPFGDRVFLLDLLIREFPMNCPVSGMPMEVQESAQSGIRVFRRGRKIPLRDFCTERNIHKKRSMRHWNRNIRGNWFQ